MGCSLGVNVEVGYLEQANGRATEADVDQEWGPPTDKREADGQTVWHYRNRGVTGSIMMPNSGVETSCEDYWLTFDQNRILRSWIRKECNES